MYESEFVPLAPCYLWSIFTIVHEVLVGEKRAIQNDRLRNYYLRGIEIV